MARRIALSALQQRDYLTGTGRHIAELFSALPGVDRQSEYLLYVKPDQRKIFPAPEGKARQRVVKNCPSNPMRRSLWEMLSLAKMLVKDGVDLYHGPANFLPPKKVCPYICTMHDMVYFHNPKRTFMLRAKYWQYYIRMTWHLADMIVTDSEFSKGEIQRFLPVPPEKIRVIPCGVDHRFFEPSPDELRVEMRQDLGLDESYILYVGRLDPDKNVERVVHAFHSLREKGIRNYRLVIAGAKDYQASRPAEIARELGLGDSVLFTGYIKEEHLIPLYQEASALCFPSLNEGFGLPPLESMAAGTPVVTSNISSLPEVCGKAGVLVDPTSVQKIADGLELVLTTSKGEELVEAGRQRARLFSWERVAESSRDLYTEVLGR
jgi:glycosyltransferase involved in cell wall biosynthesis